MTSGSERLIALVAVVLGAMPASAGPNATDAFTRGRDLFRAGKFADACPLFEQSEQADPQMGTLFNLAQCDEKIGKLASAIAAYREVVAKDSNAKRKAVAAEYAVALEQRVPKIVIAVVNAPPGLTVTLDGKPAGINLPIEVDFGDHPIAARADGFRPLDRTVKIDQEIKTTSVPIALEPVHAATTAEPAPGPLQPTPGPTVAQPADQPAAPASHRKTYGVVGVVVGGAAIASAVAFGALAQSRWSDAKAVCGGTVCPTQPLVDQGNQLASQATSFGNLASGLAIGGVVVLATGVTLWLTAPSSEHSVHVSATLDRSSAGAAIAGRF